MKFKKLWVLVLLMLIGELTFLLPFVIIRIFRPTFLTVFDINNFQLGSAFAVYGVIAMISYFVGGPIADRFVPRKLLPVALFSTAIGGVVMMSIPSIQTLPWLYGYWGLTTVLLFWASFIKAQREFGGHSAQGKSFGAVDGGRGLIAAIIASFSVFLLDSFLPVSADKATPDQLAHALQWIIGFFALLTALGGVLVWLFLRDQEFEQNNLPGLSISGVKAVMNRRSIWLQSIIVLCAYVGYKSTDDFGLFAKDTFGYHDVESAYIATITFWVRPVAAVFFGFIADKFIPSKIIFWCFVLMLAGSLIISLGLLEVGVKWYILMTISSMSAGIYGLRGVYYALYQEANIPVKITGSATGIVAFLGYTPDIFMGPLMGIILDSNPGALGHQYFFGVVAAFAILGIVTSLFYQKTT